MPQSNSKSIEDKEQSVLAYLVEHESELKRLFKDKALFQKASDPFKIKIEKNVTITNQIDEKIYNDFKDFCKSKRLKVKAALMRAMLDLMLNYQDFNGE